MTDWVWLIPRWHASATRRAIKQWMTKNLRTSREAEQVTGATKTLYYGIASCPVACHRRLVELYCCRREINKWSWRGRGSDASTRCPSGSQKLGFRQCQAFSVRHRFNFPTVRCARTFSRNNWIAGHPATPATTHPSPTLPERRLDWLPSAARLPQSEIVSFQVAPCVDSSSNGHCSEG